MLNVCTWQQIQKLFDDHNLEQINAAMKNPAIKFSAKLEFYAYVQQLRADDNATGLFGFEVAKNQFELHSLNIVENNQSYYVKWMEAEHNAWQEFAAWSPKSWTPRTVNYLDVSELTPKTTEEADKHFDLYTNVTDATRPEPISRGLQHYYEIKDFQWRRETQPAVLIIEHYENGRHVYNYVKPGVLSADELALAEQWHHTEEMLFGEFLFDGDTEYGIKPNEFGPKTAEEKARHLALWMKFLEHSVSLKDIELTRIPTVVICIPAGEDPGED